MAAKTSDAPTGSKFGPVQKPKTSEVKTFNKAKMMTPEEVFEARLEDAKKSFADASEVQWRERMYSLAELILSKDELKKLKENETSESILEEIKKNLKK